MARGCTFTDVKTHQRCKNSPTFQCYECGDRFCLKHAQQCRRCGNHVCNEDWEQQHKSQPERCKAICLVESQLQELLRYYLEQLEPGLETHDFGKEGTVRRGKGQKSRKGRTDIQALDKKQRPVVIELKAGAAEPDAVAQIKDYLDDEINGKARFDRGILVAASFTPEAVKEAQKVRNLELRQYTFKFRFPRPK